MGHRVNVERRAHRLTRAYPSAWRDRYGDEFECLLVDQMLDGNFSFRQSANVVVSGCAARASLIGLRSAHNDHAVQRWSPMWMVVASTLFIGFGGALWGQLTIGWQWARPTALGTRGAMCVMSLAMLIFALLTLFAAASFLIQWWRQRHLIASSRAMVIGAIVFLFGLVAFTLGAIHFSQHWPGTHGHPWSGRGLVPGGIGAFAWSATSSITAYWAHPAALAHFPTAVLAWMLLSPVALTATLVGLGTMMVTVRRDIRTSTPSIWWTRVLGITMLAFLFGALWWLVDGDAGPRNLFHRGVIDIVDVLAMIATFAWSLESWGRWHRSTATLPSS